MSYRDLIEEAQSALSRAKDQLNTEIRTYPTPISGCDAQFNFLLAERRRITSALADLNMTVFIPTPRAPSPGSGIESR